MMATVLLIIGILAISLAAGLVMGRFISVGNSRFDGE